MQLTAKGVQDGGLIVRTARKEHRCAGNGAGALTKHAPDCVGTITPGETYVECLWSTAGFQSGSHHCPACAVAFLEGWVEA